MGKGDVAGWIGSSFSRTVAAALGCASLAVLVLSIPVAAKQAPVCGGVPGKRSGPEPKNAPTTKLDRGTKVFDLRFDDGRGAKSRNRSLSATPPLTDITPINAQVEEDLVTSEDRTISPGEGLTVTKDITGSGKLAVCVAIAPKEVTDLHAGSYIGDVVISAPGGEAVSVPIEATFRSSSKRAWAIALGGAFGGLLLKVASELAAGKRKRATWKSLRAYFRHWSFLSTLVATPVLAGVGYYTLYADNATWGALQRDEWKLFVTCVGFQLGGVGLVEILKKFTGSAPATEVV